jgi:hypothetical protein
LRELCIVQRGKRYNTTGRYPNPNAYASSDTNANAHAGSDADTYTGRDSNAHPLSDTRHGDKSCRDRELIHADFSDMD